MSPGESPQHTPHPDTSHKNQDANGQRDDIIAPVAFTPLSSADRIRTKKLPPMLPLLLGLVLVLSALALWFLLTARAVTISVSPPFATVRVGGGPAFSLTDHYLLRPGSYQLHVTADGYLPYQGGLLVTNADQQQTTVELVKMPGHLEIVTTPHAAQILIDGEPRGTTPATISALTPGDHQLLITAPRYLPLEQTVAIEGLDRTLKLSVELQPGWGELTLTSTPAGATILVDGQDLGTTPATVQVLASGESVTLSLAGYKTWQQTMSVPIGERLEWPLITLAPADAQIHVESNPPGASITVNGQYSGTTPASVALAPGANHQLHLFLNGYEQAHTQLALKSGEQRELSVQLKAKLGTLNITSEPAHASLYVDGQLRGTTPQSLTLPARAWKIEIRQPGFVSEARTLTPKPKIEQTAHFALKTAGEASGQPSLAGKSSTAMPPTITSPAGQQLKLFRPNTTFTMGASRREQGRRANEVMHEVTLSRPFYLSVTEVTNEQFRKFRSAHSSSHADSKTLDSRTQPVVNINWHRAAQFCNWLSKEAGLEPFYIEADGAITGINRNATGYRLPSEAEWAWAARYQSNGVMLKYPWGDTFPPTGKIANIADQSASKTLTGTVAGYNDGYVVSAPVGSFSANDKGIHDLGGNVSEWLNDYYSIAISVSDPASRDPLGPETGEYRVIRGASWRSGGVGELRLAFRDYSDKARDDLGFRVARYAE